MTSALATRRRPAAVAVVVLLAAGLYLGLRPATADHSPADKVSAAGSTMEVFDSDDQPVTLLSTEMRTSSPTDLVLQVTAECSIVTDVTTVGDDDQSASGTVRIWVEIDGEPVPVAGADGGDDGEVVFCNRLFQRETDLFDDQDATIRTYMETRAANAFNWVWLDTGHGVHTIEVLASLEVDSTQEASAEAVVGNRTLVVEPTKMKNDASLS